MDMEKKTYIIFTIDTETDILNGRIIPISKMVYGEVDGEYYGITRLMDFCEKYNCKATFFVSTYESHILGEVEMKKVCNEIFTRGHDVQLHTHPKWITQERFMWNHPLEKQEALLTDGKEAIKRWTGEYPIAHRAGGFGADHNTLQALSSVSIPVDSSNIGSPFCKLDTGYFKQNTIQMSAEGVIELPITHFAQFKIGQFQPIKPFDINANTLSELKFVISAAKANNINPLTLLMHSFSFLHRNKDRTNFTPNKCDLKKFERLLQFIAKDKDLEVVTVKEFYKRYRKNPQLFQGREYLPVSGYFRTIIRAFRYINRGKGNQLIVLSVFILLIFVFTLIFILTTN